MPYRGIGQVQANQIPLRPSFGLTTIWTKLYFQVSYGYSQNFYIQVIDVIWYLSCYKLDIPPRDWSWTCTKHGWWMQHHSNVPTAGYGPANQICWLSLNCLFVNGGDIKILPMLTVECHSKSPKSTQCFLEMRFTTMQPVQDHSSTMLKIWESTDTPSCSITCWL